MNDTVYKPEQVNPEKSRKKWLVIAAVSIILGVFVLFFWWYFNRPAHGSITVVKSTEERFDPLDPAHRKRYQGKYFTFTYPSDFHRREENESVKFPILERLFLVRNDIEGRKIALTLQDNTGNSFEEYGSFRIRRADPAVYQEEVVERNGEKIIFFTKSTSVFEVSAFFHRKNLVFSVTVSSPTTVNGLREEVDAVLDSFEWKDGAH